MLRVPLHSLSLLCGPLLIALFFVLAPPAATAAHTARAYGGMHAKGERGAGRHHGSPKRTDRAHPAGSAADAPKGAHDDDDIETVEAIEPVEASPAPGGAAGGQQGASAATAAANTDSAEDGPWTLTRVVAHLHPAAVHMPIAWLILLVACESAVWILRAHTLAPAGRILGVMTLLSFLPAMLSGLLRLNELPQSPEVMQPAVLHRNLMFVSAALLAASGAVRWPTADLPRGPARGLYFVLLISACALVAFSAHRGGQLVYGDTFLPF